MNRTYLERGRPVEVITRWAQPSKRNPLPPPPLCMWWHKPPKSAPRNVAIRRQDGTTAVRPFRGLRRLPTQTDQVPEGAIAWV